VSQRPKRLRRARLAARALGALVAIAGVASADERPAATSRCRYSEEGKLVFSPRGVSCPAFAAPPAEIDLASELAPRAPVAAAPAPAAPARPAAAPAAASTPAQRPEPPAAPERVASAPSQPSSAPPPKPAAAAPAPAQKPAPAAELAVISRAELAALLAERDGLAEELARIRDVLEYQDREAARRVAEASLARIAEHLDAEERLLLKLGAARGR
jgi:hypothetical protein